MKALYWTIAIAYFITIGYLVKTSKPYKPTYYKEMCKCNECK